MFHHQFFLFGKKGLCYGNHLCFLTCQLFLWTFLKRNLHTHLIKGISLIYFRFFWIYFFICTNNEKNAMMFLNELNTKYKSITYEYQISETNTAFLDTKIYIKNNKLYTKLYRKNPQKNQP